MQPWYKVVVPRKEVRQGRSFNPDEFAIALEQVVRLFWNVSKWLIRIGFLFRQEGKVWVW